MSLDAAPYDAESYDSRPESPNLVPHYSAERLQQVLTRHHNALGLPLALPSSTDDNNHVDDNEDATMAYNSVVTTSDDEGDTPSAAAIAAQTIPYTSETQSNDSPMVLVLSQSQTPPTLSE